MKNTVQCPKCRSKHVKMLRNSMQIAAAVVLAIIGLGFFVPALTMAVGYYLFALPLFTVGSIGAYKVYSNPIARAHCDDCKHQFEHVAG